MSVVARERQQSILNRNRNRCLFVCLFVCLLVSLFVCLLVKFV